jgi:cyclase
VSAEGLKISVQAVAPRIWRCAGPNAMCSSVVFVGDRAALVADSMVTPGLARQVKAAVRELAGVPIRYLLNTHGDSDHIFGNQEFWPESVLLTHRLTRDRLLNNGQKELAAAKARRPELASELEDVRIVVPEVAFDGELEVDLGGLRLNCVYVGPAHTSGDVIVWAPEQRFLFTADVVFSHIFPVVRNGDPSGWLRALDRLEELRPEVVAPGHGEVGGPELIREQRDLLMSLQGDVNAAIERGLTLRQALDTVKFPQYEGLPRAGERIPETIQKFYSLRGLSG